MINYNSSVALLPKTGDVIIAPIRILVVEDDECLQPAISKALHLIDPKIIINWVTTARQAAIELQNEQYDLVIADYMLPNYITGLWIWERCKKTIPHSQFLLMSG